MCSYPGPNRSFARPSENFMPEYALNGKLAWLETGLLSVELSQFLTQFHIVKRITIAISIR